MENHSLEHFGTPCELPKDEPLETFDCVCGAEITEFINCDQCGNEGCKSCMCTDGVYWFCGDDKEKSECYLDWVSGD